MRRTFNTQAKVKIWHFLQSLHIYKLLEQILIHSLSQLCEQLWLSCTTPVATHTQKDKIKRLMLLEQSGAVGLL